MVRKRKSKQPITKSVTSSTDSAKPKSTRTVIRQFHVLLKRRAHLQKRAPKPNSAEELELGSIESQIAALGGLEAYQDMSAIGQGKDRGGGSETVLIGWLKELGLDSKGKKNKDKGEIESKGSKLQLLEVGALKPDNYASCSSWISCTPIDLRSRHPDIREQDFLQFDVEANAGQLDIVSLSLVVNFVPDARDRGKMLRISHDILRPPDPGSHTNGGLMFLVLPTPCVTNSRYMTTEHLLSICAHLGFTLLRERCKPGGKVSYWLFTRTDEADGSDKSFAKKSVLREGSDRNNFSILLDE
ncbi:nucleolus protein [Ceratobasidium sp. AG-Ba]|nr:nucleolus protein [Ceratobasidium sp. AG-Ba]